MSAPRHAYPCPQILLLTSGECWHMLLTTLPTYVRSLRNVVIGKTFSSWSGLCQANRLQWAPGPVHLPAPNLLRTCMNVTKPRWSSSAETRPGQSSTRVRRPSAMASRGGGVLTELFAGMAGMQVLEWADLDSEIKTAGLKNVKEQCLLSHVSLSSSPKIGRSSTSRPVRDVLL